LKCELCGKEPQFGDNISHSKRHTQRRWLPNIGKTTIVIDGKRKRINICTRCLRTQQKVRS
jgi:large subunit ribosomal protein L28